jgi:hypothetical protein
LIRRDVPEMLLLVPRSPRITVAAIGLALACACSQTSTTQVSGDGCVGNCGKGSRGGVTGAGGNGGNSSGAGSSSSSGGPTTSGGSTSTTNGTSSSSSGLATVGPYLACPAGFHTNCPDPICRLVVNEGTGQPQADILITLYAPDGVPLGSTDSQTTTQADGSFYICPPLNTPFYVTASGSGFQTANTAIIVELGGADEFFDYFGLLYVLPSTLLSALSEALDPPPLPGTSFIAVAAGGNASCDNGTGYSVMAVLPDGGTLSDGGALPFNVAYVEDAFPDTNLSATTDAGAAFLYNIDSSLTNGLIVVTVSNPGVPASCSNPTWSVADMTGVIPVSENSFSETVVPTL